MVDGAARGVFADAARGEEFDVGYVGFEFADECVGDKCRDAVTVTALAESGEDGAEGCHAAGACGTG